MKIIIIICLLLSGCTIYKDDYLLCKYKLGLLDAKITDTNSIVTGEQITFNCSY